MKDQTSSKGYSIHIRTTESRYKAMAKTAIDEDVCKNVFIERAIDFYIYHLTEENYLNSYPEKRPS